MIISKRQFMRDWIYNWFDMECISIRWDGERAILSDGHDSMVVEMVDRTLYAGGKPYASIPSLVEVVA